MSVIIHGLNMPKDGRKHTALLQFLEDGKCRGIVEYSKSYDDRSVKVFEVAPLPEGHGRLGDLDALQEEFKKSHDGKRLILIDTAPTIIEADLEWKMKNCCCFSNTDQAEGGTDDDGNA